MLASLNSLDIFNLVLEGRNVVLNSDEIIYPLIEATEDLVSFSVTTIGDDVSGTVYITIDNNKQVTKIINKGITIPVPSKNDTNKILSVGTDNNAQWINIPSGSGSSSVYLQDEEPENASIGSLWLDTDEENNSNSSVSASEISTAISEHNISTIAHDDIRKAITQADYSEDDSSNMSYIKNRPFYEGKTFTAINTILNNEIVNFLANSGVYMAEIEIDNEFLISSQIKPNTKYKVIFDGMEFIEESVVYDLSQMGFFHGAFIGENPLLAFMAM